jgi:hypothetical protein
MATMATKERATIMSEIKAIIRRNPDWVRRRAHRDMLLAMVQRINRERKKPIDSKPLN